jgi:hypothetical protein
MAAKYGKINIWIIHHVANSILKATSFKAIVGIEEN